MGFKHEKLQHNNSEVLGFIIRNRGIVMANDKYLPYDRTGNATLNFTLLITYLQQSEIFSTHIPQLWRIQMFINHWNHFTLIHKVFIADTTELWTLITMWVKMYLHLNLHTKSFIIHITATWTLSTMCALICLQITHVSECFTAQITDRWTWSTKHYYVSRVCSCVSIRYFWLNVLLHKSQAYWH